MRTDAPAILVISTDARTQVSRLSFRFWKYGCRVSALCGPDSELRVAMHMDACYSFRAWDPLASLRSAIEKSGAEYILPGDALSYCLAQRLAMQSAECRKKIEQSLGPLSSLKSLGSRYGALAVASELGIRVPVTIPVSGLGDIAASEPDGKFPIVLKRDGSGAGRGVALVEDSAGLAEAWRKLAAETSCAHKLRQLVLGCDPAGFVESCGLQGAGFCAQQMIEGVPANAMFACWQGRVLGQLQARSLVSERKRMPALVIELIHDDRIARAGELLARKLQLSGFFGLGFISSEATGEPYLISVNPYCTQLGHIQTAGRTDLAGLLWAQWTGRPAPDASDQSLSNVVSFYPFMPEKGMGGASLAKARWDIDGDALLVGTRVLKDLRGPFAWMRRNAYMSASRPLSAALPVDAVHYFKNPQ